MRTKGATSCVFVRLSDLNEHFKDDAVIPISRRFADQNGLTGHALHLTRDNIIAAGNQPALTESIVMHEVVDKDEEQT